MKLGKRCNMTIDLSGTKTCMRDGKIHRKGGPAIEYMFGDCYWYENGVCHREDGPAYENKTTGYKQWFLHGIQYTEENHRRKLAGEKLLPTIMNFGGASGIGGDYFGGYITTSGVQSGGYVSIAAAGTSAGAYANTPNTWLTGSTIYVGTAQSAYNNYYTGQVQSNYTPKK